MNWAMIGAKCGAKTVNLGDSGVKAKKVGFMLDSLDTKKESSTPQELRK